MTISARDLPPFAVLPRGLAPLGYRNFAVYWLGFLCSNSGRFVEEMGTVWLLYKLTSSPVLLGLLGVTRAIPMLLVSPIAGVVADRVDQRRFLAFLQVLGLIPSLCLGLLVLTGVVQVWHVYLEVLLQSTIMAFDAPTRQALFPRLVPRGRLIEAVTLQSTAGRSSALIGPAIGGFVIAAFGDSAPFILNSATFPVLMIAVLALRGVAPRTAKEGSSFWAELIGGMRYIVRQPVLSGLLKLEVVLSVFQMNSVLITIVGLQVMHVGPEGLGGLLSAPAFGALFGITWLMTVGHAKRPGRLITVCICADAVGLLVFAASREYALSFAALALIGLLDILTFITRQGVIQLTAPGPMRGRVMANVGTVNRGIGPMAQTQSGVLAGAIGAPAAAVVAAFALAFAAVATARTNSTLWRLASDDLVRDDGPAEPAPAPNDAPSK